jgi:hypothetical protein
LHVDLEFLRPNHGHEEVDEQQQRDDSGDDVFHSVLLQFFAKTDVKSAHNKEGNNDADED